MSRTYRTADHYTEWKIRIGERDSWSKRWDYTDPRCIARMRNGTHSYHSNKIDPRSYKVSSWREYTGDTKVMAKRAARRNAKILIKIEAHIIMQEVWDEFWEELWSMDVDVDNDNWYEVLPFDQDWEMESYREEYDYYYYRDSWDRYY